MPENNKQSSVNRRQNGENNTDENADDVLDARLPEGYPPLAPPWSLAKEYDPVLLQKCSAARLSSIAKAYKGVDARLTKPELFQALFDKMMGSQECVVCGEIVTL